MADDLIEIELGFDRFEAQLIAARCEAADLTVGLRLMDNHGQAPGMAALQAHRLLVRAADQPMAQSIIDDARGPDEPFTPMATRRPVVWVMGVAFGTFVVWTMVNGLAQALG